jgi:hypothetical protein
MLKKIKKEVFILLVCLVAALAVKAFSVLKDKSELSEFNNQWHVILLVAFLIYLLVGMFRLFAWGINMIFQKNKK